MRSLEGMLVTTILARTLLILSRILFSFDRRAKTWRTGGYYEIPTGGYDIVFWETTSTNLTATVAAGERAFIVLSACSGY